MFNRHHPGTDQVTEVHKRDTYDASRPIVVGDLHHSYTTRSGQVRAALGGLELIVEPGGFLGIIGPSGCGKSTLLRLLGGLDSPDRGSISIGGSDPIHLRGKGTIGLIPQSPALLPWRSVAANVGLLDELGRWEHEPMSETEIDQWLDQVGLCNESDLLPHQLSGGMQQRAALARAFALQPSLLLMDEPFSALDELTRHQMQVLLRKLCAETQPTVIFVTHSIDEAVKLADRVIVLSAAPGRIVADIPVGLDGKDETGIEDTGPFRAYAAQIRAALLEGESGIKTVGPMLGDRR